MKIGDRVKTAQGAEGVLVKAWTETTWTFGIPSRIGMVSVALDGKEGWRVIVPATEVKVIEEAKGAP
jgi:hypothetical protein